MFYSLSPILACQAPFDSVLTKPWPTEPDIDYNSNDRPVTGRSEGDTMESLEQRVWLWLERTNQHRN